MKLSNGVEMPSIGFGTFRIKDKESITNAINNGYTLIDNAKVYENEEYLKAALTETADRSQNIFLTSKVWTTEFNEIEKEYERACAAIGVPKLDLYLLHWPRSNEENLIAWKQMEELYKSGKVGAIGVSNFQIHHLEYLRNNSEIFPMVNQVECHLNLPQYNLQEYAKKHGCLIQSYCSLMENECDENEIILEVAKKHNATPQQICLSWLMQREILVIPRSTNNQHQVDNFAASEIKLTDEDMEKLKKVNKAKRYYPDPDNHKF